MNNVEMLKEMISKANSIKERVKKLFREGE